MASPSYTIYETAIGGCAIAWTERGIVAHGLPEPDRAATIARMARRFPDAAATPPPPTVAAAMAAVAATLAGAPQMLDAIDLDMGALDDFHRRVYRAARAIPWGQTRTYGELARDAGDAGAARAVGQAMGRNPYAPIVPCHRVVAANGRLGGFSASGGLAMKLRLLAIEGALGDAEPTLFAALPRTAPPRRRRGARR